MVSAAALLLVLSAFARTKHTSEAMLAEYDHMLGEARAEKQRKLEADANAGHRN